MDSVLREIRQMEVKLSGKPATTCADPLTAKRNSIQPKARPISTKIPSGKPRLHLIFAKFFLKLIM